MMVSTPGIYLTYDELEYRDFVHNTGSLPIICNRTHLNSTSQQPCLDEDYHPDIYNCH